MITAALGFITSRKWLMEAILAGVIIAGLALYRVHLIEMGKQEQKDADTAAYAAALQERDKQAQQAQVNATERSKLLATTLDAVTTQLDDIKNHPPKASVKYVQLPGESCPSLRLDPEWVHSYEAASAASGPVPHP